MIRRIIRLALFVAVLLLGYNYFFGSAKEREQSERIVGKVKDLGSEVASLFKDEHQKLKEGKYDQIFSDMGNLIDKLKKGVSKDSQIYEDIQQLDKERRDLEKRRNKVEKDDSAEAQSEKKEVDDAIEKLIKDAEALIKKVEAEGNNG